MKSFLAIKILIVEDEVSLRVRVTEYLEEKGYRVFQAGTRAAGWTLLVSEWPDLIIMDIYLGGSLGLDLAQDIAKDDSLYRKPKILVVSGTVGGEMLHSKSFLEENCVHGFLKKPFDLLELEAKITTLLKS